MTYFENVEQKTGLNKVKENPCNLLDFGKVVLKKGECYKGQSGENEILMVILGGKAVIKVDGVDFGVVGGRPNVFSGKPHSVYIPCSSEYEIVAESFNFEAAMAMAKCDEKYEPYVINPEEVETGKWGISNFSRNFHGINVNHKGAVKRLIAGETYTPSGNWSTYPAHKHEVDNLPNEVFMEEMYYFKVNSPEGFGLAKYYTDDLSIDEVYTVKNETILMMPKGYHTVVSAPGFTTYYLWFLAGNCRIQCPVTDPNQAWVNKAVPMIKNIEDNL